MAVAKQCIMNKNNLFSIILCFFVCSAQAQPTTAATTPPARTASKVVSLFSGAYTNVAGTDWFPAWGQSTIVTDVTIAGNATKKYASFNYQGVQFLSSVDASNMDSLHLDVWTPNCTSFEIYLINTSPTTVEQKVTLTPVLSGWNSFNIAISQYNNIALNNIGQFKFVGTPFGTSTVYLDNIYFYKSASSPTLSNFSIPTHSIGDAPFALIAPTSNSTGAFSYTSSNTSVATISGNMVTITGVGTSIITAKQAAAGTYGTGSINANLVITSPPPATAAPTPPVRTPANVVSLFSGAYTNVAAIDWFPNWGQTTIVSDLNIVGNPTKKYENFNYQGVQFASAVNAAAMNYLHIDIWTADCLSFDAYLVNTSPSTVEQKVTLSPSLSGWNSFDIALSQYNTIALNNIGQLKFVGTNGSTVYLDNIYFYHVTGTPPTVNITSPVNNASFNAPVNITINATATDDSTITKVQFYNGATLLGQDVTSPYSFVWNNVLAGTYNLTAKATDNSGLTTTSSTVKIIVSGPSGDGYCATAISGDYKYKASTSNGLVTFTMHPLTPIAGCAYALIYLKIGSGGYGGYGMTPVGTDFVYTTAIPAGTVVSVYFTYQVPTGGENNSSANPHTYTVGTNCTGITGIPKINITSPAANASFNELSTITIAANATDSNGTVSKVEFYRGSTLLGTDITSPYSFSWASAPAGNYNLVAKVTDNTNLNTFSTIVPIVVKINNSIGFCGTIAGGDYSYRIETVGSNVVFTFHPLTPIAGCTYAFIYVREGLTGPYPGYAMTAIGSDFRFTKSIASGTPLSVYFTYQVPSGGEHTSVATPHSYNVGTSCLGTFPVVLSGFSATLKQSGSVAVTWASLTEVNNDYYLLEKSTNGIAYKTISKIPGRNNSNTRNEYSVLDENPAVGLNYYRLSQVDKDGKTTIFGIKTVNVIKVNMGIVIYPNPLKGKLLNIILPKVYTNHLPVQLIDVAGRLVFNKVFENVSENLLISMPEKLQRGVYLLKVEGYSPVKLVVE